MAKTQAAGAVDIHLTNGNRRRGPSEDLIHSLIGLADDALYCAKDDGRNRIVAYGRPFAVAMSSLIKRNAMIAVAQHHAH